MPDISEAQGFQTMLRKKYYVVVTTPTNGLAPVRQNVAAHLEHQVKLEKQGVMFAAGPLLLDDEVTMEGEGMFVLRADSLEEARRICESDPMHQSGARSFTVRPWLINEGGFTMRVTFSDQAMQLL